MIKNVIKLLMLEGNPYDAELNLIELRKNDLEFKVMLVSNSDDYLNALKEFGPDVILIDFYSYKNNGLEEVTLAHDIAPLTPVIIISSTIGEEMSVDLRKQGVVDFVLKGSLEQLSGMVTRALAEALLLVENKEYKEAIDDGKEKYSELFNNSKDAIFLTDTRGFINEANRSAEKLYGYTASQFRKLNFNDLYKEASDKINFDVFEPSENDELLESIHINFSSKEFNVSISSGRYKLADRSFNNFIVRDITVGTKIRDKATFFAKALEQSPVSILITDTKGITIYVNPAFLKITGYTMEELIGENPRLLKSGEMPSRTYKKLWATILDGKTWKGELQNKRKDGSYFWEQAIISGIKNEKNTLLGFIAIKEDITWRRKMEHALKVSEERYRKLFTAAPDPIIELNLEGYITSVNPSLNLLLGRTFKKHERVHMTDSRLVSAESAEIIKGQFNEVAAGKLISPFEVEIRNIEQAIIYVEVNLKLITHEGQELLILAILRDTSERKKAQDILFEAIAQTEDDERNRISSEIHDGLQQTLICASMEFQRLTLDRRLSKNKVFSQGLDFLNQAINESRNIAHSLMPKTVEVNGLVPSLIDLVSRLEILSSVKFVLKCDLGVKFDVNKSISVRIYKIVQESINNALKHAHPSTIRIHLYSAKSKLILKIVDDGSGFDPESVDPKKNFGIMSMRHKVDVISGTFSIKSEIGIGTEIYIEVPLALLIEN